LLKKLISGEKKRVSVSFIKKREAREKAINGRIGEGYFNFRGNQTSGKKQFFLMSEYGSERGKSIWRRVTGSSFEFGEEGRGFSNRESQSPK
jgi:hypothetical protein